MHANWWPLNDFWGSPEGREWCGDLCVGVMEPGWEMRMDIEGGGRGTVRGWV